jgi:hypothetical protein
MGKKLVCDVFDAVMIDNTDGSVAGTTTLQGANIDVAVSEVEVRAGRGNALIATLHIQRDISVELTDVEWKPEWIAKQLGTSITTGAGVAYAMPKYYTVVDLDGAEAGTALGFTLDEEPLATASGLTIYDEDEKLIVVTTDYTIAAKVVTIVTDGVTVGDVYEVRTYKYATPAATQTLTMESDKFAKGVTLALSTFETDEDESNPFELQYQFTNCIPNGSFQIQTSSEKKAATQSLKLKVIKPNTSTVAGKLLRIPLS